MSDEIISSAPAVDGVIAGAGASQFVIRAPYYYEKVRTQFISPAA
jgi:hypothetical protein